MELLRAMLIGLFLFGLSSCVLNRGFKKHLLETINDPRSYQLPTVQVIDSNFYSVLDSAISSLEKCKHFDDRVKYMYAFLLSNKKKDSAGQTILSVYGLLSVEVAIGLDFNRSIGIDKPWDIGVFFYKNYLFAVPLVGSKGEEISLRFYKKTDCFTTIRAYSLYHDKVHDSYFDFVLENGEYRVIENHVCGSQILIRR